MKRHLRSLIVNVVALWTVSTYFRGLSFGGGLKSILLAALALTLVNFLIKPIIGLLFLPINLLTLGMFRWLVNVITLYLVTLLVPNLFIKPFVFPGFNYSGFIIPKTSFNYFWSLTMASFLISLTSSVISWLVNE